jgi:hypothetical protein
MSCLCFGWYKHFKSEQKEKETYFVSADEKNSEVLKKEQQTIPKMIRQTRPVIIMERRGI